MKEKIRDRRKNSSYPEIRVKRVWVKEFQLYLPSRRMFQTLLREAYNSDTFIPKDFVKINYCKLSCVHGVLISQFI